MGLKTLALIFIADKKNYCRLQFIYSDPLIPTFSRIITLKSPGEEQKS